MALLERISAMQQQGIPEEQIVNSLIEEGFPPMEINEALSQSKIKSAVSTNESDMQPSIMSEGGSQQFVSPPQSDSIPAPYQAQAQYPPQAAQQPVYAQEYSQAPAPQAEAAYPPADAYASAGYAPEYQQTGGEAYYAQAIDLETVKDVSKQIVEEAMRKIREEVSSLSKLKTELKFEIQDIENRVVKIEGIIQELQTAVIRKMGEYGETISGISREIRATQDSFSKMVNPIMDTKRKKAESTEMPMSEAQPKSGKSKKSAMQTSAPNSRNAQSQAAGSGSGASFEDYFR